MSRTFRRKNQKHEYIWALKDWDTFFKGVRTVHHSPKSPAGRKAIAVFHSDAQVTMASSAPRWYRGAFEHRRRTRNNRVMRLWLKGLADPILRFAIDMMLIGHGGNTGSQVIFAELNRLTYCAQPRINKVEF